MATTTSADAVCPACGVHVYRDTDKQSAEFAAHIEALDRQIELATGGFMAERERLGLFVMP